MIQEVIILKTKKIKKVVTLLLFIVIYIIFNFAPEGSVRVYGFNEDFKTRDTSNYFKLVDEEENVLLRTGHILSSGNKYLTEDNKLYKIVDVTEENVAKAKLVDEIDLSHYLKKEQGEKETKALLSAPGKEDGDRKVGIYHSHGAESYEPTDGSESIDQGGGIIEVGKELKETLENKGVKALWSSDPHTPHDAGAYARSRRTAEELLKENPDALFDVHRDAAPREEYKVDLGFDEVVQILLVVGQQQPNFEENSSFAESIKALGDEKYQGFIKGILYAEGSYNQDLHPRSLLLEVGGHENTRDSAESSAGIFSSIINTRLYDAEQGQGGMSVVEEEAGTGGRVLRSILWLIGAVVVGVFIFLAINNKDLNGIKKQLKDFFTREFN